MADENRGRWTKLVDDFEASELTQREFAQERGVSHGTLRNWVYRLRKEARPLANASETKSVSTEGRAKKALRLIPVEVIASAPYGAEKAEATFALELILASGARLRFAVGTNLDYLQALAAAL